MIHYLSTRGRVAAAGFEEVLLEGLAADGGLLVPESWPELSRAELEALRCASYAETAARVLAPFTEGAFAQDELRAMAEEAYAGFAHDATAPLRQLAPNGWLLELFHGPTLAFKDFALQLLARMFERVLERRDRTITIIGATSGDTGSAAIHACAGRRRMRIVILHPHGRISEVQRRQMTTVRDDNVVNVAIRGSFDDCQALVKRMFADEELRAELGLAAINSINWARIAAQVVYYVYAGLRLGAPHRPIAFSVPTGNFGDVYAGYVAANMGLPVARLIVATNRNDILSRFLASGRYEIGEVVPTLSPSMDIQVASNFERLLFDLLDRDGKAVAGLMAQLRTHGRFELAPERLARAGKLFDAARIDEETTLSTMAEVFARARTIVDPHSAVGIAAGCLRRPADVPLIALATADPAKFPDAVQRALGLRPDLPAHLAGLYEAPEHYQIEDPDEDAIRRLLRDLPAATA